VLAFTPLIILAEAAVLGIGCITARAVALNHQIERFSDRILDGRPRIVLLPVPFSGRVFSLRPTSGHPQDGPLEARLHIETGVRNHIGRELKDIDNEGQDDNASRWVNLIRPMPDRRSIEQVGRHHTEKASSDQPQGTKSAPPINKRRSTEPRWRQPGPRWDTVYSPPPQGS
jgi:hypothetical protein